MTTEMSKVKYNRNDTGFPLRLSEYVKSVRGNADYPFLKYYQNIVRLVLSGIDMNTRGLLINHEMGLGKSILAVAAAIDMMPERQPIVLMAKSLMENMRGSIVKYVKMRAQYDPTWPIGRFSPTELDSWIAANFSFVSMNASNMLTQVGRAVTMDKKLGNILEQVTSLDGKLLIVDEAHNLFRAIVNGSKNGIGLYNLVQKSKNLKILFLTGTPIANDPFELVPAFNMLGQGQVLPEDYIEFNRLYVGDNGMIKNREKFQNRLFGLVSAIKSKWLNVNEPRGEFPERLPLITVRVPMDHVQYTSYSLAREREREEGLRPGRGGNVRVALVKPKSRGASTYRVKSRQIGNFDAPAGTTTIDEISDPTSPKFEAILANIAAHDGQKGLVYSQFVGMGGLTPFRKFLNNRGWNEMAVHIGKPSEDNADEDAENTTVDSVDSVVTENTDVTENTENTENTDVTENTPTENTENTENTTARTGSAAMPSAMEYIERIMTGAGDATTGWWLGGDTTRSDGAVVGSGNTAGSGNTTRSDGAVGRDGTVGSGGTAGSGNIKQSEYDISAAMIGEPLYSTVPSVHIAPAASAAPATDNVIGSALKSNNYVVISGEVDVEDRTKVQEMFNDPSSGCNLIIVSSTGAEGLDLKRIRHIHIMEPYWNWGRIEQIISRGVRNDSHIDLPADQKNVQGYIYLAVPPATEEPVLTTDVELYEDALKNRDGIDSFLDAIDEVSIECTLDERNCRMCNPTGEPLFSDDPTKDVRTRDTCSPYKNEEIEASEIVIDGKIYHYAPNTESVFGVKIFEFDKELGAYRQIKESNPIYRRIYATLNPDAE